MERGFGRRETSKEAEAEWGRQTSSHTGVSEVPFLLCIHPSFFLAGRSLLLHSCPVSAAVAGALLLLSAQGEEQRRHGGGGGYILGHWGSQLASSAPKAVLACINISSMRQMFFQMQELPQLWRISRMDFVRVAALLPDCRLLLPSIPSLCPGLELIVLVLNAAAPPPPVPPNMHTS